MRSSPFPHFPSSQQIATNYIFIVYYYIKLDQLLTNTRRIHHGNHEEASGKIGGAQTEEEVNVILEETKQKVEDAGIILDDKELDKAAGGMKFGGHKFV